MYIRPEKLGMTTPEQISRINQVGGEAIQAARDRGLDWRAPVTNKQTEELATRLALRPSMLMKKNAERMTTGELLATEQVLRRADDQIATISRQMGDPNLTAGQALDLSNAYDVAWADYRAIFSQFSAARSEAGRSLQILGRVAQDVTDPIVWQRIAAKAKGGPLTTAEMQRIRLIGEQGNPRKLVAAVQHLAPGQRWAQFATLVKMGYLSKPSTHVRNVGSNAINVAFRTAADIPATLMDAAVAPFTGQHVKSMGGILEAAKRGAQEGVVAARKALREGASPETLEGWDLSGRGQFENPILNGYVEVLGRTLDAEDQFFRRLALQRALSEEAYSLARTARLQGPAATLEAQRLLASPTEEMVAVAARAAEEAVYRQVTPLHTVFQGAKTAARRAGHYKTAAFLETAVAPFTRTPLAVGATALNYSPVGVVRAFVADLPKLVLSTMKGETAAIRNAQRAFVERASRGMVGSAGMVAVGYRLRSAGLMTGAYPTNPSERSEWETEGKQPYSVRFMGQWRSMVGFAPFGTLLAMGASYHDARQFQAEGEERKAAKALGGAVATITEQPALQGMRRTFEATSDILGAGSRYLQGQAGSVVPGFVGATAQTVDPVQRRPETMFQAFKARVPGLSQSVPARPNVFGEDIVRPGSLAGRAARAFVDPFASSPDRTRNDPLVKEMARVGVTLGHLTPRPDETPEAFRARERLVGAQRRAALEDMVANDPEYRDRTTLVRDARWLIANDPNYEKLSIGQAVLRQQAELMRFTDRTIRQLAGEPPQ
jgi:hypothetical protein